MGKPNPQNLKPCKPGETHNPNGRPPKLVKVIKGVPKDAQEKIYGILLTALQFKNVEEATAYIRSQDSVDFKYGFVLQVAIKALAGKRGWDALNDILDRLFGRPRQTTDIRSTEGVKIIVQSKEEKDKLENMGDITI